MFFVTMRQKIALLQVICSVLLVFTVAYGSEFTAGRIQKAYEGIRDIKGSFVQKSHIKDLKRTDTFKGTFMIKMPSKMRWQYSGDNKQGTEVIIKNDDLLIYQKDEKQVLKGRFDKESYGQSPIVLLSGLGDIKKEFEIKEKEGKLLLTPKNSMGGIVSVEIVPSDGEFPIGSLTIIDKRSNRIEITLKAVTLNSGIKDSVFDFSPPKGVSVYEYNQPNNK